MAQRVSGWVGWIWFGALAMIVVGIWGFFFGLAAVLNPSRGYISPTGKLLVFDLTAWGWWHLILGILVVLVGICLIAAQSWARYAAIVLITLNLISQFPLLAAQPWWSITVIGVSVFVLWALVVHGDESGTP
jgi:hypothetical protein